MRNVSTGANPDLAPGFAGNTAGSSGILTNSNKTAGNFTVIFPLILENPVFNNCWLRGLLKFSEFYCLSHVYEMSDANDDSE